MTFLASTPNEHYRELRLISAEGRWELGFTLFAAGPRLRMGRIGLPPSVLDFCLGKDASIYMPVLTSVLARLESIAETATNEDVDAVFPWAGTRADLSIHLDLLLGTLPAAATRD
jgi:hypothetical protein